MVTVSMAPASFKTIADCWTLSVSPAPLPSVLSTQKAEEDFDLLAAALPLEGGNLLRELAGGVGFPER